MAKKSDDRADALVNGRVRVRVRAGGRVKLSRDRTAVGGERIEVSPEDLLSLADTVETDEQIKQGEKAVKAAQTAPTPLFAQLRMAARQQRDIKQQAHEADNRRTAAELASA